MGSGLLQSYVLELEYWVFQICDAVDRDRFKNHQYGVPSTDLPNRCGQPLERLLANQGLVGLPDVV